MRILTPKQLLEEPYGITYIQFIPETYIGDLTIKSEYRGNDSWWGTNVAPWVIDDGEFEKWYNDKSYKLKTDGFTTDDATYNHNKSILYAVFDKEEVKNMIKRLQKSLESY